MKNNLKDASAFNREQEFFFYIDVTGACNLRCPSCPNGNCPEWRSGAPKGFMPGKKLEEIMKKAASECRIKGVGLYNWFEPFLHPELPELVRVVKSHGVSCALSTNLNYLPDPEPILKAGPDSIRISLSGFRPAVYNRTHKGGDIEQVKKNLKKLMKAARRVRSSTEVTVFFLRYRGNRSDEAEMRRFTEQIGCSFQADWAHLLPLEKNLAYIKGSFDGVTITKDDRDLIESLAFPIDKALDMAKDTSCGECELRNSMMAIDFKGRVMLCCAVYNTPKYVLGDFLSLPVSRIQELKNRSKTCAVCTRHGLNTYFVTPPEAIGKIVFREWSD